MVDSQDKVFELIFGRWRSQILYTAVKTGIFDALGEKDKDATTIAQELGLDDKLSYRLFRTLSSLQLLRESENHIFSLTDAGQLLRADHPKTLRTATLLADGARALCTLEASPGYYS